jgi:endonuclease/exonuclease/phosphatase family metal-dependent hydrolase
MTCWSSIWRGFRRETVAGAVPAQQSNESIDSIVVATHNVMHGRRLEALVPRHLALRDGEGLDLLCLQEDRFLDGPADGRPSARIAAALGDGYQVMREETCPGLALVADGRRLQSGAVGSIPLPRLASLSWFERRYIVGAKTKQKHALWAELRPEGGPPFTVVTFHLDTAGGQRQRAAQAAALAAALARRGLERRLVACGDTNAFSWRSGRRALDALLAPFAPFGAHDPETRPTHRFARQNEPMIPHRLGVALGRIGLDLPRRYDVVCTNLSVAARGQIDTPGSDHDLVWARLRAT